MLIPRRVCSYLFLLSGLSGKEASYATFKSMILELFESIL